MRCKGIVACSLAWWLVVVGQIAVPQEVPPTTQRAPVPVIEQIKKSVVFVWGDYPVMETKVVNGVPTQVAVQHPVSGTAFLIFLPEPRLGPNRGLDFLVTNRHVIREPGPGGEIGEGPYFKTMFARINTKEVNPDGTQFSTEKVSVVDDYGCLEWLVDSDDSVDLAITPIFPDEKTGDFLTIPKDLFATKESLAQMKVDENDEILFTGLFASYAGEKRNYPIVRHGKLALLSRERIPFDPRHLDRAEDIYLADVMSFGGNSGSPVFLRLGGIRDNGFTPGYSYYLLGVMQGYFGVGQDVVVEIAEKKGIAIENSGIAAVIPSDKIDEILESPRARAFREGAVAAAYFANGKFDDAEKSYKTAISLLETSAPEHSDLAVLLNAYSELLRKTGRSEEAQPLEEQARKIRSNVHTDRMHPRF